jgi:hypothetical protein
MYLKQAGETREITQYHYLAWPDHGVPDSSEPLEEIIKLINAQMRTVVKSNALKEPTLVAHCRYALAFHGRELCHLVSCVVCTLMVDPPGSYVTRPTVRASAGQERSFSSTPFSTSSFKRSKRYPRARSALASPHGAFPDMSHRTHNASTG